MGFPVTKDIVSCLDLCYITTKRQSKALASSFVRKDKNRKMINGNDVQVDKTFMNGTDATNATFVSAVHSQKYHSLPFTAVNTSLICRSFQVGVGYCTILSTFCTEYEPGMNCK